MPTLERLTPVLPISQVGVSEARLRKWILSVTAFLRRQEGSLGHAISLWRDNLDREFEGTAGRRICAGVWCTRGSGTG